MANESNAAERCLAALKSAALSSPGRLPSAERVEICNAARSLALDSKAELGLSRELDALVRAVVQEPATTNVAGALAAGRSDDEVFEIVISAALGAALARADAGLTAMGHRE